MYKPTICFIVYVAYEQKEVENINVIQNTQDQQLQQLQIEMNMLQEQTETDNGMILYYYTIYTTLF